MNLNIFTTKKIKEIIQDEMYECGLASLAICFNYHKIKLDLSDLRTKHHVSNEGLTMYQIIDIAEEEGFIANLYEAETEELIGLQLPAILHWEMNHFVVLSKIKKNSFIIVDPAIGTIEYSKEEFNKLFTGYALELEPDINGTYYDSVDLWSTKQKTKSLNLNYFLKNSKNFYNSIGKTILIMVVIQFISMLIPMFSQIIIDDFISVKSIDYLLYFAIAGASVLFFRFYAEILKNWYVIYIGYRWHSHFSEHFFKKILNIPLSYFTSRGASDVFSRFSGLHKLKEALTDKLVEGVIDSVMVIFTLIAMFIYNSTLAFISLLFFLLYLMVRIIFYNKERMSTKKETLSKVKEDHFFLETIRSMESVKNYGVGKQRFNRWKKLYLDTTNRSIELSKIKMWYTSIEKIITGLDDLIILFLGAIFVINNQMSLGMLFAFIAYKTIFSEQGKNLINNFYELKLLGIYLDRLSDIENTNSENFLYGEPAYKNISILGNIKLENVSFKYKGKENYLFENLNLEIKKGENVVIVGESGKGKSTLLKIMMGLLPIESGRILIDGIDIKQIGLNNYRKQISSVNQNEFLLLDSILNNISFYSSKISLENIKKAAEISCISDDIEAMNMQYETIVDEMGSTLSGGQTQRILLSRALYRNPSILFLDEATSSLDYTLEKRIIENLKKIGITRVSIAHRQESIKMADRVIDISKL